MQRRVHGDRGHELRAAALRVDRSARARPHVAPAASSPITARRRLMRPPDRMRRLLKIVLRVGLALFALVFVYLAVTFVQVWMASRRDEARPSDAIIVLGAARVRRPAVARARGAPRSRDRSVPRGHRADDRRHRRPAAGRSFHRGRRERRLPARTRRARHRDPARDDGTHVVGVARAAARFLEEPGHAARRVRLRPVSLRTNQGDRARSRPRRSDVTDAHESDQGIVGVASACSAKRSASPPDGCSATRVSTVIDRSRSSFRDSLHSDARLDERVVACVRSRLVATPIRGWCNRQHDRFWSCYWGFNSSPPSWLDGDRYRGRVDVLAPSSSGLGRRPLKAVTAVRIRSGLQTGERDRGPADPGLARCRILGSILDADRVAVDDECARQTDERERIARRAMSSTRDRRRHRDAVRS